MRKEEFTKGNYVHVYNRGSRSMPIVRDAKDRWRFLQGLYYFNSKFTQHARSDGSGGAFGNVEYSPC
jgi:hypothetical protein